MRRRPFAALLACLLVLGLGAGAVALASGGSGTPAPAKDRGAAVHHKRDGAAVPGRHRGGMRHMLAAMVLGSLADRLGVEPAELRDAGMAVAEEQWAKRLDAAGLTAGERAALKSCGRAMHGLRSRGATRNALRAQRRRALRSGSCDRAALRSAVRKLKAAPMPDLAALKQELATSLGDKLGVPADKVLDAVRAELVQRLGQAVAFGVVTEKGRDLALACFDAPASCDLEALRGEVRLFGRHARRG